MARYGNVQPSEFYAMADAEAEAWAEALNDLAEAEREAAAKAAFMHGDFGDRFK